MMKVFVKKFIFVLCGFCFVLSLRTLPRDFKETKTRYIQKRMEFFRPPLNYLLEASVGRVSIDKREILRHIKYYELLISRHPDNKEIYHLLGFCYYHIGQTQRAIDFFEKANAAMPHFFWSHYNLGFIYYSQGKWQLAREYFQKALEMEADGTYAALMSKRAFQQIIFSCQLPAKVFVSSLAQAKKEAFAYIVSCTRLLKKGSQEKDLKQEVDLISLGRLRIFL